MAFQLEESSRLVCVDGTTFWLKNEEYIECTVAHDRPLQAERGTRFFVYV